MARDLSSLDPTGRFSNRVDNYVKYRPSYPEAAITFFREQFSLAAGAVVADIGAGTGIFSALLLRHGYTVYGVEPNDAMRQAAEEWLTSFEHFTAYKGTGEATGLPDHCADLVTVAQAFHWMDPKAVKQEFARILKPGGRIALIWNIRLEDTPFLAAYEALKSSFSIDYTTSERDAVTAIGELFAPATVQLRVFPYEQLMDFDSLKGQLLSASYIPLPGNPQYEIMIEALTALFEKYQENGLVRMRYDTKLYWGDK